MKFFISRTPPSYINSIDFPRANFDRFGEGNGLEEGDGLGMEMGLGRETG